jgi:hypothetical protein
MTPLPMIGTRLVHPENFRTFHRTMCVNRKKGPRLRPFFAFRWIELADELEDDSKRQLNLPGGVRACARDTAHATRRRYRAG